MHLGKKKSPKAIINHRNRLRATLQHFRSKDCQCIPHARLWVNNSQLFHGVNARIDKKETIHAKLTHRCPIPCLVAFSETHWDHSHTNLWFTRISHCPQELEVCSCSCDLQLNSKYLVIHCIVMTLNTGAHNNLRDTGTTVVSTPLSVSATSWLLESACTAKVAEGKTCSCCVELFTCNIWQSSQAPRAANVDTTSWDSIS